jgi:hypothetical protein
VAVVVGRPITRASFDHWLFVAAKSQARQTPGAPVIVPSDPPAFNRCIAQVRRKIRTLARWPKSQLRADCAQLFHSLSGQVMDFLIRAYWYEARAATERIYISRARVQRAFRLAERKQFSSPRSFKVFLRETGQTRTDVLFRFRINLTHTSLLKKLGVSATALDHRVEHAYKRQTLCARYYTISECA